MHEHSDLIEKLGGPTKVAAAVNGLEGADAVSGVRVQGWKKQGVSWRWRPRVAQLAMQAGIDLPSDFLPGVVPEVPDGETANDAAHSSRAAS